MAKRGNPNPAGSKPDKLMRDAILVALNREAIGADGQPTKKLYQIAEKLVECAVEGKLDAIREINDRIDGKSHQTTEVTIDDKRDNSDWTRSELVALLSNARNGGRGTVEADGRLGETDKLH